MDAETFISSATIDGVAVPLHWRFDPGASRIRNDSVSLAYGDRSTGLRLYWEWRAAARYGPIEHVIRIENPGRHEVWIPLQDSFRFAWKIASNQQLEQLWVDKGAGEAPPVGTHLVPITDGCSLVWRIEYVRASGLRASRAKSSGVALSSRDAGP